MLLLYLIETSPPKVIRDHGQPADYTSFKFLQTAVHGLEYQIFESLWLNKSSVLTF